MNQLMQDYSRELEQVRRDLRSSVRGEERIVQDALVEVDLEALVEDVTRDASHVMALFADEVELPRVVREALDEAGARGDGVSSVDRRRVRRPRGTRAARRDPQHGRGAGP